MDEKIWLSEEEHKLVVEKTVLACVDCLIIYNGNYLLCRRNSEPARSHLWFPGGKMQKGESIKETTERVCQREIGQKVKFIKILGVEETKFDSGPYGIPVQSLNAVVLVEAKNSKIKLDESHSEFIWVPFANQPQNLHPYLKSFIEQCFID